MSFSYNFSLSVKPRTEKLECWPQAKTNNLKPSEVRPKAYPSEMLTRLLPYAKTLDMVVESHHGQTLVLSISVKKMSFFTLRPGVDLIKLFVLN